MNETVLDWGRIVFTGPWSTVWPVLVLPTLAVLSLGYPLRKIEGSWSDPAVQVRVAALVACIPAIIIFSLACFAIRSFINTSPETWRCYVKTFGPLVIVGSLFLRASILLYVQRRQMSNLIRVAHKPCPRLAKLGKELGVPVREIATSAPLCMVAGLLRPTVLISVGAMAQLEDEALRAALLHERAHIRNWDTLRSAAITFLSECAPFRAKKALELHRVGREVLADREAARYVKGVELAAVLVRLARNASPLSFTQPLAQTKGLEWRVRLLLENPYIPKSRPSRMFPIFLCLASTSIPGLYALASRVIDVLVFHCAPYFFT